MILLGLSADGPRPHGVTPIFVKTELMCIHIWYIIFIYTHTLLLYMFINCRIAARTAMGQRRRRRRRRRRGAWGRPQRVPVKSLNDKEKTEMREILKNQDLTSNLSCKVVFYQKT